MRSEYSSSTFSRRSCSAMYSDTVMVSSAMVSVFMCLCADVAKREGDDKEGTKSHSVAFFKLHKNGPGWN